VKIEDVQKVISQATQAAAPKAFVPSGSGERPPSEDGASKPAVPASGPSAAGTAREEPGLRAVPLPAPTPPDPDDPKIPKDQIRRIAFLYAAGQKEACAAFEKFLKTVALKVSKKPLQVRNQATLEVPAGASTAAVLEAVKASGAAGALALFSGMPEAQAREIEEAFAKEDFFLRAVVPDQLQKRTFAMDMTFEIMLLRAG
jgi:hypothetical protein